MAETLGLITNRRNTKDGFRPAGSSRVSTHQGWPGRGSLPRFLAGSLGSITRGRGHGRDVGSHHQPPLHQGRLRARELVADLDRAVVELLDVDRTAGLEQEAHARTGCAAAMVSEPTAKNFSIRSSIGTHPCADMKFANEQSSVATCRSLSRGLRPP